MRLTALPSMMLALVVALALSLSEADAQGKGKLKKHGWDDRGGQGWYDDYGLYSGGRRDGVPPGWCKGRGNPHNTPENCGFGRRGWYDDRYPDRLPYPRRGSFYREHDEFHRYLDWKYTNLAARRPLDLEYQLRLRLDKRAEHQRWHYRRGIPHD